ncbi:LysR family transcriptional regulator [Escherichia coli]
MMKIEPSILPSLAWFALIVRAGSFTKQPLKWVLRGPHCPQNLKSLEERLNTKLIYRTTRNMSLTEEGQHLYEVLVSALGQIDDALKDVVIPNLNLQDC